MNTTIELHILQNFAPSNLNRDDTGSPKDCEFGGYRRARISSQCIKRAMRKEFQAQRLLEPANLAVRTKRLRDELAGRLAQSGRDAAESERVAEAALAGLGLKLADGSLTQYLVFVGEGEVAALHDVCMQRWDALLASAPAAAEGARGGRSQARPALPNDAAAALKRTLDGGRAADLALFGRMLADLPDRNTDAAAQVAHAISTNQVSVEFDFYTAVDDLKSDDTSGADMLGTVEFNSACFYRYANVDVGQLEKNLGGDDELVRAALAAFIRASVDAVPTGKQNSMAAHNPPELVMAVVRTRRRWSLANAFLAPARPRGGASLMETSVSALDRYWGSLAAMYGMDGIVRTRLATLHPGSLAALSEAPRHNVDELVASVVADATRA